MSRLKNGFSLAELLVSLSLLSLVVGAALGVLDQQRRAYHDHITQSEMRQDLRTTASLLQLELGQLDATDSAGSDILGMSPSSIAFRVVRNTYFLCRSPESGVRVTINPNDWLGLSPLDLTNQTFLLLAGADSTGATGDGWLHVGVASMSSGTACPAGMPSITLSLSGVTPAQLAGVSAGAPFQGLSGERILAYPDASGDWWLGLQEGQDPESHGWSTVQPLAGPLAPAGLLLRYFDQSGNVTGRTDQVARIEITIQARTQVPLWRNTPTGPVYGSAAVTLEVALGNNRRRA